MIRPNLEKLVTSLETSKKLKEMGAEQVSLAYWQKCNDGKWRLTVFDFVTALVISKYDPNGLVSAFTTTEVAFMDEFLELTGWPDDDARNLINSIENGSFSSERIKKINANLRRFWEQKGG
jgi:hypothetical protein